MKSASKVQIFLYISIIFRNFAAESCKDMVAAKGFRDNKEGEGVNYIGDRLYLEDMHPANVFIDATTNQPTCIDCIVKFIKKE